MSLVLYCDKCNTCFDGFYFDDLKAIYGAKIPKELALIHKSKQMKKGIVYDKKGKQILVDNYDNSNGTFKIQNTNKEIEVYQKSNHYNYNKDYKTITHQKCSDVFLKYNKLAKRCQNHSYFDYETFFRIIFPISSKEQLKLVNKKLYVYYNYPKLKTSMLIPKTPQYLYFESKCPQDKIVNPATNRCVNKNGIVGRNIIEKSEKISDLLPN